jgi:CheY-specific phosphatase CheX
MLAGFGKFKLSDEPFLKASRTLLLPVNAMIPLSGSDHMAGHLIVSVKEEVLRALYRDMFQLDAPSVEALEDMTGEIANMLAGGLKALIEKKGTSLFIGVPTFIRGSMISFRRGLLTPSLSLGATHSSNQGGMGAGEDLFVELTFERIDPTLFDRKEEVEQVGEDELTFL